ncbi:hypothetical protein BV22DRAFT_1026001, partial [Leucogyrophana mollusca]
MSESGSSDDGSDWADSPVIRPTKHSVFHGRNGIPRSFCRSIKDVLWVSPNASTADIPREAITWKDRAISIVGPRKVSPTGLLLEMEWSLKPDWYRRAAHWHAWL